jgi:hypothetical protein
MKVAGAGVLVYRRKGAAYLPGSQSVPFRFALPITGGLLLLALPGRRLFFFLTGAAFLVGLFPKVLRYFADTVFLRGSVAKIRRGGPPNASLASRRVESE